MATTSPAPSTVSSSAWPASAPCCAPVTSRKNLRKPSRLALCSSAEERMNKVVANADEAIRTVTDGASIMMGGFGLCGIPENLIAAVRRKGVKGLTVMSNNAGVDDFGIGLLL